jgi:DNA polymerase (family 10)
MLSNQEVADQFALAALLMELHDENAFKIRAIQQASYTIERLPAPIMGLTKEQIENTEGLGKSIASKILQWQSSGNFSDLLELQSKTPAGILSMIGIKGVGPKRIRTLWKEHGIDSAEKLLVACQQNVIANLKGFGDKSQQNILRALQFKEAHAHEFLYADIENYISILRQRIIDTFPITDITTSGAVARQWEIVDRIEFIVSSDTPFELLKQLQAHPDWTEDTRLSSVTCWRGTCLPEDLPVGIRVVASHRYGSEQIVYRSAIDHLKKSTPSGLNYRQIVRQNFASEEAFYERVGSPFVPAYLREGLREDTFFSTYSISDIIQDSDIRGAFHNHTTYSDGQNTLYTMATYLQSKGYSYLGISDHSQTASYAGGLKAPEIATQQKEIKELNETLAPFKIFSGIESDILTDGSLDYPEDILKTFDFIVASIHSGMNMTEEKATQRLIKAVENPYTTMLGHPTGRLLLKREGYPIDHKKIIDACAANHVIIEINAHPLRLDMDWRHIGYALDKGCIISINPDAHEVKGYHDMHYGVLVAQKAGVTKDRCFNAWTLEQVENWLKNKKGRSL